jgi:hypothetical protein
MIILRIWDHAYWWFLHATGSDNGSGPEYLFHSGFGANLAMYAAFAGFYWHQTCHVGSCPFPARHEYDINGVKHKLCIRHHPHTSRRLTAAAVADHAASRDPGPGVAVEGHEQSTSGPT